MVEFGLFAIILDKTDSKHYRNLSYSEPPLF